jgi:glycosyltransferase involved in cell wall biosynthesis
MGIHTLIRAHRPLRQQGSNVELLLAERPIRQPRIGQRTIAESWNREPGITWLGHVDDVPRFGRAHIAVLPSRREGLPKAARGRRLAGR